MQPSQSTHLQSFIEILADDIRERAAEESLTNATAATRVLLEWLGYELSELTFLDGSDRGIDAWLATDSGFELFQVKTHELTPLGTLDLSPFDGLGVRDLERARDFLLYDQAGNTTNKKLKELLYQRDSALRSHKLEESSRAMPVTLHLVVLGDQLTPQAYSELQNVQSSNSSLSQVDGVAIQFRVVLHTIQDIIDVRWREEHRDWLDRHGRKHESISLGLTVEESISDSKSAVFYCLAIDLVNAYDTLGYQLFEPNVRANIKNSRVNQAIRESILHQRTRREFHFLNNGVTITCDSFSKPTGRSHIFLWSIPAS